MYEHYERHRTDNITDPALRRAHPISTISGWDRERDENAPASDARAQPALANGNGGITPSPPPAKISKSEQTDDEDVVGVKCACIESVEEGETETKATDETPGKTNGTSSETAPKPVSSISSISQVYNEQLCNGNGHAGASEDDDSMSSPKKESSGSEALRQTLELGDDEASADAETIAEDNKEIVEEIVEEILKKSEDLLDDCKRTLDEDSENAASSVIKDEEIEHAVSEVVKGVRQIEKMANKQETETDVKSAVDEGPDESETTATTKIPTIDETCQTRNDNQKTDLVLSSSAIVANNNKRIGANDGDSTDAATTNDDDNIEEIVTHIVNEVIDNCVNQTLSTSDVDATTDGTLCDKESDKTSILQNDDNINNNTIQSQAAEVVNAVLSEAISATTPDASPVEETSEQIVTSILNEIVETCVQNAGDDNNNREVAPATEAPVASQAGEKDEATLEPEDAEKSMVASDHGGEECPASAANRAQGTSISTSTQVENNHFGEYSIRCECEQ